MPKYILAYHGGGMPEGEEAQAAAMAAWGKFYEDMGPAIADGGAPVGLSKTVTAAGVEDSGGANPLSGYTLVTADTIEAAWEMAKGCPILKDGGTVEVAQAIEM